MIEIINTTKSPHPKKIPYTDIANTVLGKDYELSVVFCGRHLIRRLNKEHRNKDYATDVLSFPLSDQSGEVFICQDICRPRARKHERTLENYLAMLFVHATVHLKGYDHGDTMERLESVYRKKFNI